MLRVFKLPLACTRVMHGDVALTYALLRLFLALQVAADSAVSPCFVRASSGFFPLIPSLIPQLMCFCACGALVSGTQQVTENRYITDNPPENRMVDGDPLPENRPITRVSGDSGGPKKGMLPRSIYFVSGKRAAWLPCPGSGPACPGDAAAPYCLCGVHCVSTWIHVISLCAALCFTMLSIGR